MSSAEQSTELPAAPQSGAAPTGAAGSAGLSGSESNTWRGLQHSMLQAVFSAGSKAELLAAIQTVLAAHLPLETLLLWERDTAGRLTAPAAAAAGLDAATRDRLLNQLRAAGEQACRSGELAIQQRARPAQLLIAAAVPRRQGDPDALAIVLRHGPVGEAAVLLQLVVSQLLIWQMVDDARRQDEETRSAAALVELLEQLVTAPDHRHAAHVLAAEVAEYSGCRRVAVGLGGRGACRLTGLSGVSQYDRRSAVAQAIESAMDEAVLRGAPTRWPDDAGSPPLALKHLCGQEQAAGAVVVPLLDSTGDPVGALLVQDDDPGRLRAVERFAAAGAGPLAAALSAVLQAEGGRAARLVRWTGQQWGTAKGRVTGALLGLLLFCLALPLPYQVRCDCQVEPVRRRFVAAPFAGTLKKSLVEPGDLVAAGDVLAVMDGREVRWRLASVTADRSQAVKRRDAARATQDYAEQQIAQLEIERLSLELRLLEHRAANLEIRSPIGGIVVSGDLERVEGAPLTTGQSLFEIAPLNRMIAEAAVPDSEVALIRPGQRMQIRLDALAGQPQQGDVLRIEPRSEIRDDQNVFIVEAGLDNPDGRLRPGMKGRAKIATVRRPLVWILLHRPARALTRALGW